MVFLEPFLESVKILPLTMLDKYQEPLCDNKVRASSIPNRGKVNEKLSWSVSSHVASGSCRAACGIAYYDGPVDKITVWIDGSGPFEIPKKWAVVKYYTTPVGGCTGLNASGQVLFPVKGDYKIWLAAGYLYDEVSFIVTDKVEYSVTIEEPTPPTPPPAPTPTEIPIWVLVLLGMSLGVSIAAIASLARK